MIVRRPGATYTLILLVIVSITVMILDQQTDTLRRARLAGSVLVMPIHMVAEAPTRFSDWMVERMLGRVDYHDLYVDLRRESLELRVRLAQLESVELENRRLRRLLSASRRATDDVLLAELVEVSLEPFTQQVLINRGAASSVYEGQPVLDPNGVLGQVTRVGVYRSAVSLITDSGQAVPVQVRRNGLRCIVYGTGRSGLLKVPYLDRNADIRRDDILISSGMGGHFPRGYPVARVTDVTVDVNEPFLGVSAVPVAALDYGREVLLVWPGVEDLSAPSRAVAPGDIGDGTRGSGSDGGSGTDAAAPAAGADRAQ
jgi:rod shape-determining protein MreC